MPPVTNSVLLSEAVLERLPFLRNANVRFFDFGNIQIIDHSAEVAQQQQQQLPDGQSVQPAAGPASNAPPIFGGDHVSNAQMQQQQQPQLFLPQHTKSKSFSGVVVITDEFLAIASFPASTSAPIMVPHFTIIGVSRDGASVLVRTDKMNEVRLTLPKVDAFVVHLVGIQDRAMSRTLRLAGDPKSNNNSSGGAAAAAAAGGEPRKSPRTADPNAVRRAMSLAEEIAGVSSAATDASMERLWGVIRLGRGSARAGPPTTELDEGSDASSVQTVQHVADSPRDDLEGMDSPSANADGGAGGADGANKTPRAGCGSRRHSPNDGIAPVEEAEVPAVLTDAASLRRRLWYFFMYYDQGRLPYVDELVRMHGSGDGKALMKELEQQYGPEPHRFRWSIRDQTIYQREITSQLRAQLARAQDELLLLKENAHEKSGAIARVLQRKEQLVAQMMGDPTHVALAARSPGGAAAAVASPKDTWRDIFSAVAGGPASGEGGATEVQQAVRKMYNVLSFHDVVNPPERALIEWSLIVSGAFWNTLKNQITAMTLVRNAPPRVEVTNEDVREMVVCNRDFLLAWIAEAHGECTLHLRHIDGTYCFMSLSETFPHVTVGL